MLTSDISHVLLPDPRSFQSKKKSPCSHLPQNYLLDKKEGVLGGWRGGDDRQGGTGKQQFGRGFENQEITGTKSGNFADGVRKIWHVDGSCCKR